MDRFAGQAPEPTGVLVPGMDVLETWQFCSPIIDQLLTAPTAPLNYATYMAVYTALHNCRQQAPTQGQFLWGDFPLGPLGDPFGAERPLYGSGDVIFLCLCNKLQRHCHRVAHQARTLTGVALLRYYMTHWQSYTSSTKKLSSIFAYLDRHREHPTTEMHSVSAKEAAYMNWLRLVVDVLPFDDIRQDLGDGVVDPQGRQLINDWLDSLNDIRRTVAGAARRVAASED
ncbi:uncharacterized protein L969DRAFT_84572 [Mixia osmundae IAM 14324]|uniref:Cullin N-terminal domain-containing protein n=1 Tax=Mixia osmundae (strain CBS 9802 / IAM 14324 / JCM 22182 / KY 12970) TaxID=764103 RepID=G7E7C1_MIXOS|nr:uncharacterized protein L969DRAFT_84572 [Mixia osmundae IAM 14324]KEI42699.1 hypothetical protein L969DRAFT_84572 [Mixia osmundae IAM 14324]GAA98731.1 hypothetical protein E5Q_05419 [Mixia osmundae IAM 14324]